MEGEGMNLQTVSPFYIFEQLGFLLDGILFPLLHCQGALHHFGSLSADMALIRFDAGIAVTVAALPFLNGI